MCCLGTLSLPGCLVWLCLSYTFSFQKNLIQDKQAVNQYSMTVFPLQNFGAHTVQHQTTSLGLSSQVIQSRLTSTGQNSVASTIQPQTLGGFPIMASVSVPSSSTSSMVGTTDLRYLNLCCLSIKFLLIN